MIATSTLTRFAALLLAAVLPFALTGCGDSHDKAMKDMVSVMNRMADTLATVKDKATAEAAKEKLKGITEEMKAIKTRMDKLGNPTGDAEKALKDKYEKEMSEATSKMMGAAMKIATAGPEAAEVLKDAMSGMKDFAK